MSTLRCKKSKRYVSRDALDVSVEGGGGEGCVMTLKTAV